MFVFHNNDLGSNSHSLANYRGGQFAAKVTLIVKGDCATITSKRFKKVLQGYGYIKALNTKVKEFLSENNLILKNKENKIIEDIIFE